MDFALQAIEMGFGLDDVQCGLQRLRVRRAFGRLKEAPRQPVLEPLSTNGMGFAVAVDDDIGEAGSIRCMEQLRSLREGDQDIGLLRLPPAAISVFTSAAAIVARLASGSAIGLTVIGDGRGSLCCASPAVLA